MLRHRLLALPCLLERGQIALKLRPQLLQLFDPRSIQAVELIAIALSLYSLLSHRMIPSRPVDPCRTFVANAVLQ